MSIVSLDRVKEHLRYEEEIDDLLLEGYIAAAESAVLNYITDEFADDEYPLAIHQAILMLIGYFDLYRNAEEDAPKNGNYLPMPVQSLLFPYRKLTAF